MPLGYQQKLLSPPFTVLVGEDEEEFSVHSAVISDLSPALDALVNGRMKEGLTKCAHFKDVSTDTFVRLCEFAYTGDYQSPPTRKCHTPSSIDQQDTQPAQDSVDPFESTGAAEMAHISQEDVNYTSTAATPGWEVAQAPRPEGRRRNRDRRSGDQRGPRERDDDGGEWTGAFPKPTKLNAYRQSFSRLTYGPAKSSDKSKLFVYNDASEDFSPVFLGHAQLYLLADKWCIADLKSLVLGKLHSTLFKFKVVQERIGDVIQFIRFVYDDERTTEEDELRQLLVQWIACEVETVTTSEEFLQLLQEGGKFVEDLWKIVINRLVS